MAYPTLRSVSSGTGTSSTAVCTLPSGITANDILILVVATAGVTTSKPSGWEDGTILAGGGFSPIGVGDYWKRATGSEGSSVNVTLASSANYAYIGIRFSGASLTTDPDWVYDSGEDANPDPPNNSVSWGALETHWLVYALWYNPTAISEAPDGFNHLTYKLNGYTGIAAANLKYTASSLNPTEYTIGLSSKWYTFTIAIKPSSELQTISDAGAISSAEAFGTAQLNLEIEPDSVSSSEEFGTTQNNFILKMSSISSIESVSIYGKLKLILSLSGITSSEAIGTSKLNFIIYASSVSSGESFGTAKTLLYIITSSIVTQESIGEPALAIFQAIITNDITSLEALGTLQVNRYIFTTGISSEENFGMSKIYLYIISSGIGSSEAIGTQSVNFDIGVTGIGTQEGIGTSTLGMYIIVTGIETQETMGKCHLSSSLFLGGNFPVIGGEHLIC